MHIPLFVCIVIVLVVAVTGGMNCAVLRRAQKQQKPDKEEEVTKEIKVKVERQPPMQKGKDDEWQYWKPAPGGRPPMK